DAESFATWYRATYPRVLGFLLRRTGNLAEAEDLASETFVIVWNLMDDGVPHLGWVFATARNVLANARRATQRHATMYRELSGQVATGVVPGFVSAPGQGDPRADRLYEAMDRLPDDQRELLIAHHWDGLSGAECAELFGCSHAAVRVRLHRARRALADLFEASLNPREVTP
ncbi:MAG: RNA polymerase sigma factor, partial [Micrococcales bacterium]|nr:RNA polymerase sigma factor [Micrococcales bacterium]